MTVAPIQDLIVDVMAAADPAAQRIAASKLERLGAAGDPNFAASIDDKIGAAALEKTAASAAANGAPDDVTLAAGTGHAPMLKAASSDSAAYRKFEAFVLQMFVESMLPKDSDSAFGKGMAGTVWRSMLAEQISNEMAKGNGVGIAKQLAKSRSATDAAAAEG
jgi:hypothetical protein